MNGTDDAGIGALLAELAEREPPPPVPLTAMVRGGLKRRFRRRAVLAAAAAGVLAVAAAGVAVHDYGALRDQEPAGPSPIRSLVTPGPPMTVHTEVLNTEQWTLKAQVVPTLSALDASTNRVRKTPESDASYTLQIWVEVDGIQRGKARLVPIRSTIPDSSVVHIWSDSYIYHVGAVERIVEGLTVQGADHELIQPDLLPVDNTPIRLFVLRSSASWLNAACVTVYGPTRSAVDGDLEKCDVS